MKKQLCLLAVTLLLAGCGSSNSSIEEKSSAATSSASQHSSQSSEATSSSSTSFPNTSSSEHEHTFSDEWDYDETYHWHNSTCGHDVKDEYGPHIWGDVDVTTEPTYEADGAGTKTCTVCGYAKDVTIPKLTHNYASTWSHDDANDKHYHACLDEGYEDLRKDEAACTYEVVETVTVNYEHGGYTLHECSVCHYQYKTDETDPLVNETVQYITFEDETNPTKITSISSEATEIIVPTTVTEVGNGAFKGLTSLTRVEFLGSGSLTLGKEAFSGCTNLVEVILPNSVTEIPENCFYNCKAMTSFEVPSSLTKLGAYAFDNCTKLESIELPEGIVEIPRYCFSGCSALSEAPIPSTVLRIYEYAYSHSGLTGINIPKGTEAIHTGAFYYCTKLTSVFYSGLSGVKSSLSWFGDDVFTGCSNLYKTKSNLLDYILNGDVCMGVNSEVGTAVVGFEVSSDCKFIHSSAFTSRKNSLQNVTLKSGLLGIGSNAFSGCSKMESFSLPSTVTRVGSYGIPDYTGVNLSTAESGGVKYMGSIAFKKVSSMDASFTSCTLRSGTKGTYRNALSSCYYLESVTLNSGLLYMGEYFISSNVKITSITIPSSVIEIGKYSCSGCTALETINYTGTMAQWAKIVQGSSWLNNVPATCIHCTDGDVAIL